MGDEEAPAEAEVDAGPVCSPIVLEACMKGADSKVKGYYEKNPDDKEKINELVSKQYGWTPLQVACGYGHAKVVTALLELGAKAGVPDKMGMTAMHSAADSDEKACMEALLETEDGKAAVNTVDSVRIRICSRTFCARTHALARVQQPFFPAAPLTRPFVLLSLSRAQQEGATPLHYAVYSNREAIVVMLLRAGATTDAADVDGKTALGVAQAMKLPAIAKLIEEGPPPLEVVEEAA